MQQAENTGNNCSVSPIKDMGVPGQGSDQADKENVAVMQRRVYVISSVSMLLIGLLLSYFPQYIQANVPELNIGTEILALLAFAACGKIFYDAYPRFFTHDNNMLLFSVVMTIVGYLLSDPGKSYGNAAVDMFGIHTQAGMDIFFRVASFVGLITLVGNLSLRAPSLVRFYEHHKGQIWRLIASKKIIAPVLGGLSVITAFCTALLQIIQIVSSLLHI